MPLPRFFTLDEVAELLRAPRSSVRCWVYTGRLAASKIGRRRLVTEDELRRFSGLAEGAPAAVPPPSARRRVP
jgi:excisionase family DNA binding protein